MKALRGPVRWLAESVKPDSGSVVGNTGQDGSNSKDRGKKRLRVTESNVCLGWSLTSYCPASIRVCSWGRGPGIREPSEGLSGPRRDLWSHESTDIQKRTKNPALRSWHKGHLQQRRYPNVSSGCQLVSSMATFISCLLG